MASLKERMKKLEEENDSIAQENESLKKGAKDSVTLIQQAEDTQKALEAMSKELADKAVEIRTLLKENRKLTQALAKLE